jgi:hypothetical protein
MLIRLPLPVHTYCFWGLRKVLNTWRAMLRSSPQIFVIYKSGHVQLLGIARLCHEIVNSTVCLNKGQRRAVRILRRISSIFVIVEQRELLTSDLIRTVDYNKKRYRRGCLAGFPGVLACALFGREGELFVRWQDIGRKDEEAVLCVNFYYLLSCPPVHEADRSVYRFPSKRRQVSVQRAAPRNLRSQFRIESRDY